MKAGLGLLPLASVIDSNLDGDADVIRCVREPARSTAARESSLVLSILMKTNLEGLLCVLI